MIALIVTRYKTGHRGRNIHTRWRWVEARSNETGCVSLVPAWHVVVMVGELVHVISGLVVYHVFWAAFAWRS